MVTGRTAGILPLSRKENLPHYVICLPSHRLVSSVSHRCCLGAVVGQNALVVFPSLPGPVVGEMLSAARFAAVGKVGRPLTHVVRDAFCEGLRASPRSGNSTGILPQLLL